MIRPIGDRVLVRPVATEAPPDQVIVTLELEPPVAGDVLAVGTARCPECGSALVAGIDVGMRVALRPGALYQEVTQDGETLWMVPIADVIGEIEPMEVAHG